MLTILRSKEILIQKVSKSSCKSSINLGLYTKIKVKVDLKLANNTMYRTAQHLHHLVFMT